MHTNSSSGFPTITVEKVSHEQSGCPTGTGEESDIKIVWISHSYKREADIQIVNLGFYDYSREGDLQIANLHFHGYNREGGIQIVNLGGFPMVTIQKIAYK